jgi:hypothetical protein
MELPSRRAALLQGSLEITNMAPSLCLVLPGHLGPHAV